MNRLHNMCLGNITVRIEPLPEGWSSHKEAGLDESLVEVMLGGGNTMDTREQKLCEVQLVRFGGITVIGSNEFYDIIQPLVNCAHISLPKVMKSISQDIEKKAMERLLKYWSNRPSQLLLVMKAIHEHGEQEGREAAQEKLQEALGLH